ncbi:zinc alcohol dehydrogenase [Umbelopsis sp. PMI_123]|nr:zinc alcohol dehydrogenase [Umbelopsis sp. PMI_123]
MTEQMRAWTYSKRGLPEKIVSLGSVDKPTITSPDQVLIKVAYTSLFSSCRAIMGLVPNPYATPRIPETEFSGEIVEYGENVREELKGPGSVEVFGMTIPMESKPDVIRNVVKPNGTLAEYVVLNHKLVVPKPPNMSLQEASGMAGMAVTAIEFVEAAKLNPGDYVLVNGGSGAVGLLLLQLLKDVVGPKGKVVATCSGAKMDLVKQYADVAIDYRAHDPVHKYLSQEYGTRKFDAIIDTASTQELYVNSPAYLNPDRPFLDMAVKHPVDREWRVSDVSGSAAKLIKNLFWPAWLGGTPRPYRFISATPSLKMLQRVQELIEDGKIKGTVDSVWGMDEVVQAYERFASQQARGRVVVDIQHYGLHSAESN